MSSPHWVPLESNPDVMNNFITSLGVSGPYSLQDVLGFDPELLELVPKPVVGLVFLYPIKDTDVVPSHDAHEKGDQGGDLFFMQQTINNACGTIALINMLGNLTDKISIDPSSFLGKFLTKTKSMTPAEKGKALEYNEDICTAHGETAQEGQTPAPSAEAHLDLHFVAFVEHNGKLIELDGRKVEPTFHGKTSGETFLNDAANVCKEFIATRPNEQRFTVLAYAAHD
ncbi:unnamed protein product [Darwinula stevensoni]|uniref:Ubiquitin carboxyl-terminal hydrolase n=1 Tax=Darwinula stevensoni TaxID=69355 RepID=A0A7R9AB69_9CRUS|nr:unnamed protein product [Darwinula stevensoni]CAG0898746.1 unnamed protein product [Darwinula stevensoni]